MTTFAEVSTLLEEISSDLKKRYPILKEWDVEWNSRLRTAMGRAVRRNNRKFLEFSIHLVKINKNTPNFLEKIRQTILHEWAHALDWEANSGWGHGRTWKEWMIRLGIKPERCYNSREVLCTPKRAKYAILNSDTGRVVFYSPYITASVLLDAMSREARDGRNPEHIRVVSLKTGDIVG
jgi:predicted SprT family Zn-dependent metalloprotease